MKAFECILILTIDLIDFMKEFYKEIFFKLKENARKIETEKEQFNSDVCFRAPNLINFLNEPI